MKSSKYYTLACGVILAAVTHGDARTPISIETAMPEVNVVTIGRLSGLDDETLAVGSVTGGQKRRIADHLGRYVQREKPRLLTYRAIWVEMAERLGNLKASAKENTFDPCEFVTDEALEGAEAAVAKAREEFENHCRKANVKVRGILGPAQLALVNNACGNGDLPAPYRWLSLGVEGRNLVRRMVRIHRARLDLARKYPNLKKKVSQQHLASQIAKVLTKEQLGALAVLRKRLVKAQATTRSASTTARAARKKRSAAP